MPTPKLSKRETATILAALRTYQEEGYGDPAERPERIQMIATDCDSVVALNDKEIDKLCQKINQ